MVDSPPRSDERGDARDRLGRGFQLRVDIAVALSLVPGWLRRSLGDRNSAKAQAARAEVVERIASAIERRFKVTWVGNDDGAINARAVDATMPLFGGPEPALGQSVASGPDDQLTPPDQLREHKANI